MKNILHPSGLNSIQSTKSSAKFLDTSTIEGRNENRWIQISLDAHNSLAWQ
jgi:hypothetical protein